MNITERNYLKKENTKYASSLISFQLQQIIKLTRTLKFLKMNIIENFKT